MKTDVVTMKDIRAAKFCSRGARDFFQANNLCWATFLREGLPAEDILATGDPMAKYVVEVARERR